MRADKLKQATERLLWWDFDRRVFKFRKRQSREVRNRHYYLPTTENLTSRIRRGWLWLILRFVCETIMWFWLATRRVLHYKGNMTRKEQPLEYKQFAVQFTFLCAHITSLFHYRHCFVPLIERIIVIQLFRVYFCPSKINPMSVPNVSLSIVTWCLIYWWWWWRSTEDCYQLSVRWNVINVVLK